MANIGRRPRRMSEHGPDVIYWHIARYLSITMPSIRFGEAFKDKLRAHAKYLEDK